MIIIDRTLLILLMFTSVINIGRSQFYIGAAQRIITPTDTAYIAGHSHNRIFQGVHDDIYVKAAVISNGSDLITLLTFDCIGLLYPQLLEIRKKVAETIPNFPIGHIVMSSTHTHSGPDVVGLWGPNQLTSGVDDHYMDFLIQQAYGSIIDAYNDMSPARGEYTQSTHGDDWVYNISEADELDRSLTALRFLADDGSTLLSLTNFACHPTFLDAVNEHVSSDYIGGYYAHADSLWGGVNMFLQGSIGGWVQPEYEEKNSNQAFYRGKGIAQELYKAFGSSKSLESSDIHLASTCLSLPVDNPNLKLLSQLKVVNRQFGDSVLTEIAYFNIGEASFATHPGETVPAMSKATKAMMTTPGPKFIMGLGMDALGYILKPSFFDTSARIPHSDYLCSVSLGVHTNEIIMDQLKQLIQANDNPIENLTKDIDAIVDEAIDSMAFPGCQIAVAHRGDIIFNKSYGHHTYDFRREVDDHHVYDVASLTKVSTGLPLLMKLCQNGLIDLDKPLAHYLPDFNNTNKADLTIRDILSHQARLQPYIVFWQEALKKNGELKKRVFKRQKTKRHHIEIAEGLYMNHRYKKKMMKAIKNSPLRSEEGYRYSGLFFLLLPDLIEKLTHADFRLLLNSEIYNPLGLTRIGYLPQEWSDMEDIVPSEYDSLFRRQLVRGHVHDEAAAMLGGVSCNAGLFANASDLCKLFIMYNDNGSYLGINHIDSNVIKEFTRYQFEEAGNRRGLGFDKPLLEYDKELSYVAKSASPTSFGHSGFTGTMAWADPENDIVFIFLSNRVYPTRDQRNIYNLNVRPRIHQAVYDYLISTER